MKKVKKIVIYGDSLSTGTHGEGGYEGFLKKTFQAEIVNYAVGSSGLSFASPNNAASILIEPQNIPEDADVVFMWHGTNDWYWGCPIGNIKDETPDTFYGAIKTAVRCIRKKCLMQFLYGPLLCFVWKNRTERGRRGLHMRRKTEQVLQWKRIMRR